MIRSNSSRLNTLSNYAYKKVTNIIIKIMKLLARNNNLSRY